jgi:hypothetical protein
MTDERTIIPLIRTKLQRPPIVGDHVHRSQLLERLDQRRQRPLTLVTAPAGYVKSTLVSCWLGACDLFFACNEAGCRSNIQNLQRSTLDAIRTPLWFERDQSAAHAAGLLYYARQGQSGDSRIG